MENTMTLKEFLEDYRQIKARKLAEMLVDGITTLFKAVDEEKASALFQQVAQDKYAGEDLADTMVTFGNTLMTEIRKSLKEEEAQKLQEDYSEIYDMFADIITDILSSDPEEEPAAESEEIMQ